MGGVGGIVVVVLLGVRLAGMVRKNLSLGICGIWYFYHGLCLKGKPWSCGHPVGGSLTDSHLTEQTRTDMSAKPAAGV